MRASRFRVRHAALALTVGCILALAALKAFGLESRLLTGGIGGVLAVAFVVLAVVDFRSSVAVVIFEVVLGGAGGHWVDYGGGMSGRIFLIAVVTLRAAATTFVDWRRGRRPVLGRYGAHALAIAFLIPAIWMPLGLVDGNPRGYVIADGNGFFFFAFVLVVVSLIRRGDGAWLRRTLFAACATSGAAYFLLIVATKSGLVALASVREWLSVRLAMGGVIGYMPGGEYRLFTAGSLFLVVGLVLTEQRLLTRPRDLRLWLLGGLFCVDLVATYTRGLWLAAIVATALVLALEIRTVRQLGFAVGIPAAVAGLALGVASLGGLSLYGYVDARAASIAAVSHTRYRTAVADPSFERPSGAWRTVGGRPLRVLRTASAARAKRHSLELSNPVGAEDAYVFQNLEVRPDTRYSVSAWVNARVLRQPAAGGRGLLVWDVGDGSIYTVPLTTETKGWQRLSLKFATGASARNLQIRLYAPRGRVYWDGLRFRARAAAGVVRSRVRVARFVRPRPPASRIALRDSSFERPGVWLRSDGGRRSLHVLRTTSAARAKRYSLELSNSVGAEDAYVFQNLEVRPDTTYSVRAWVNARTVRQPAAGGEGLSVWDAQDGSLYAVPLTGRTDGWKRLSLTFRTKATAREAQVRLYAPQGRVYWDGVRFRARGSADVVRSRVQAVPFVRPRPRASQVALRDSSFERAGAWLRSDVGRRSMRVQRARSAARAGALGLELRNWVGAEDAYVFQNLEVRPDTTYSVRAWVNARALRQPAADGRGLSVWDAQDGSFYTVPLTGRTNGWKRLSLTFRTKATAGEAQVRLYAPQGRVLWDAVRLSGPDVVQVGTLASSQASATMVLNSSAEGQGDAAGAASNSYRVAEANALLGYIRRRPIYGYGFGSVAGDFGSGYSFELSYLDLLFKAGVLGLLLYLSFPGRLVVDAVRARLGRPSAKLEASRATGSPGVVAGVVVAILIAGATNPYLFAAFGLVSILVMVAWLDDPRATALAGERDAGQRTRSQPGSTGPPLPRASAAASSATALTACSRPRAWYARMIGG